MKFYKNFLGVTLHHVIRDCRDSHTATQFSNHFASFNLLRYVREEAPLGLTNILEELAVQIISPALRGYYLRASASRYPGDWAFYHPVTGR